ncbi:MAG: hypothetical protein ACRDKX_05965, partial [Solirubrobacterales bacterium]
MRPEDDERQVPGDESPEEASEAPDTPPPATWAGRKRAEGESAEEEPFDEETGFTDAFDAVGRDLDDEFSELDADQRPERPAGEDEEIEVDDIEAALEPHPVEEAEADEAGGAGEAGS